MHVIVLGFARLHIILAKRGLYRSNYMCINEMFNELSTEPVPALCNYRAGTGVIGYTVRPNFRSGGSYSLREYGPPRTQLPREYGPPDRVPWLYKTN